MEARPEWSRVKRLQDISDTFRQLLQLGPSPVVSTFTLATGPGASGRESGTDPS